MSFSAKQEKYAGKQKREQVIINTKHAKDKMNPDQHFQPSAAATLPPPPISSFNFPYDHQHHHHHHNRFNSNNNGDNHRASPRKILHHHHHQHPHAKTDVANTKEGSKEEETQHDHMMGPSSTTTTYVITMPSCPSSSSTSTLAYSSPSSSAANMPTGTISKSCALQQSKEAALAAQTLPSTSPSDVDEFYAKNICVASALVVSYLIEVAIQILLTVQCYRIFQQQQQQQLDLVTDTTTEITSSSSPWSFWFLVISSVLSSFLVTLISIIWVFRGMDFSGRLCGRLLCYVMHSFLLGLLWRYLKLAFAYDRADLEEFFKLKTIQTYVQSLPLVTIHLAWVLTTQHQLLLPLLPFTSSPHAAAAAVDSYHALSSWLVVVEMLSAVISFLVLSSSTVSSFTYNNGGSSNNNLQVIDAASPPSSSTTDSSSPGDNSSKASNQKRKSSKNCDGGNSHKLKVECGGGKGDNNPNHHFNDSGTASSVDNHGAAEQDDNDIIEEEEKSSCSSSSSSSASSSLKTLIKWMMSHYSQKCEPGRALLLVSRVISLGMLVYKMNYYWTGFITLLHFGVSFVWLGCWSNVPSSSSSKSNGNIKTTMSTSSSESSAAACRRVHDSNDTCCDTKSNGSSSNDSGLVVKSEVLMENGIPLALSLPGDDGDVQANSGIVVIDVDDNDSEGHNNVDYSSGVNSCTRGGGERRSVCNNDYQIKNNKRVIKGDDDHHVNPLNSLSGGLSSCLSVVVHSRRNRNAGNYNESGNNRLSQQQQQQKINNQQWRQVLMRVLPLTYVLFWDLSNSPCAYQLSGGNPAATEKRLSFWATAFPVFIALVENVLITIYHHVWTSISEPNLRFLTVSNAACLALGWLLVATYQFRWTRSATGQQRHQKKLRSSEQVEEDCADANNAANEEKDEEDDVDSGYGKNKGNSCMASGGDSGVSSDASVKSISKKETGECLSFCCSSLSHPLNIKRKGCRDQRQQQDQEANNFCKDSPNDKLSSVDQHHHHHRQQPRDVTIVKYNEYQEQQELGKLMSAQRRQQQQHQQAYNLNSHNNNNNNKLNDDDGSGQSSRNNSTIKKSSRGVAKKSTIFPDLGISTENTGVNVGEEGHHHHRHQDNYKICSSSKPESMMRCRDDVKLTNKACGTSAALSAAAASLPVTNNNYTNIKEALTRRISNKSCTNGNLKKTHHHQQQQQQNNNRTSQDRESVKGDGEVEQGEARMAISSFKSSPSTRVHHQHQATPTNSNKCMPISIKSPISWLPETCCNDSNGSGSSNSRNTNTLVMPEPPAAAVVATITNGNRLFYCPEKYIDLGNNTSTNNIATAAATQETEESNRTSRKLQQPKQQRQQPHHHHHHNNQNPDSNEGNCDFSVVFFEGRAGGTSRSYKQKQCRTPVASNALLLRAARSANSTPVACSKPFPLDIGAAITGVVQQQQQNHPRFQLHNHNHHQHQYSSYNEHDDDDEVDPIERATKEKGASHRRIRNQITGKTYLSDGASLTSLDGLCEIRASTPVEIKKASRVIVNYPPPHHQISDSKTVSRCLCKVDKSPSPERVIRNNNRKQQQQQCGLSPLVFNAPATAAGEDDDVPTRASGNGNTNSNNNNNNNIYEKLIDDSYGILICEGENAPGKNSLNRKSCNNKSATCMDSSNDPHHYHHQIVRLSEASELRRTAGGGGGGTSQKLKILCAKCLENHDPLLTNCVDPLKMVVDDHLPEVVDCHYTTTTAANNINNLAMMPNWQDQRHHHRSSLSHQLVSHSPYPYTPADSDTTDYPSDTEFTTNNNPVEDDGQSLSTHFSSATYTWHHHQHQQHHHNYQQHSQNQQQQPKPTQLSQFIWAASTMNKPSPGGCDDGAAGGSSSQQQECPKEFTGLEYVRTWLMASHPRTFAISHINNNNNNSSGCNDTHQHPLEQFSARPQQQNQQEINIKKSGKNSNGSLRRYAAYQHHLQQGTKNDKGLTLLSSSSTAAAASKNTNNNNNVIIPFKHKSACDKTISKKKRVRQLEKRQRPIGRGASPPAKELAAVAAASSNNFNGNVDVLNSISATAATATLPTLSTTNNTRDDCGVDTLVVNARFQPPPSRKQHPLLFYDMIPRQEQQKPLTATSHKKCRDQLDLFHKELETVV